MRTNTAKKLGYGAAAWMLTVLVVLLANIPGAGRAVGSSSTEAPAMAKLTGTLLHTAHFRFGADALSDAELRTLQHLARDLEPGRPVTLVGYTDDIGPRAYNEILARRRAQTVADALADAGIARHLMRIEARGSTGFVADNTHREGRARNRRVEVFYRGAPSHAWPEAGGRLPAGTMRPVAVAERRAAPAWGPGGQMRVGRYSTIAPVPTTGQRDPLEAIVQVNFPAAVHTVGGALRHLIARSGWRLAAGESADPAMRQLVDMPLPAGQRSLGPLSLADAVGVICGHAYAVVKDPVHRLLSCELRGIYATYWRDAYSAGSAL